MRTHEEMKALALSRSAVRTEYERIEREEMPLLDMVLTARRDAGLSQAQIAERMGTKCTCRFTARKSIDHRQTITIYCHIAKICCGNW